MLLDVSLLRYRVCFESIFDIRNLICVYLLLRVKLGVCGVYVFRLGFIIYKYGVGIILNRINILCLGR